MTLRAVQSEFYTKKGRRYRRMSLEQRVELRKSYTAAIPRWRHSIWGYFIAIPLMSLAIISSLYLQQLLGYFLFPGTILVLAILLVALFWGAGPALFALIMSTMALEFFFVPPTERLTLTGTFSFDHWQGMLQLIPFVIAGLAIALITAQRERARLNALATEQELQSYAQELEITNKKLEDANQTKDHFISIASHELKTPITTIRGQAQLMLRRLARLETPLPELEEATKALERINEQSIRLTALIEELLDVSSMRAGKAALKKKGCNLNVLCRDVVEDQRLLTNRKIILNMPLEPVRMQVDRDRLSQVIINLISNAVKYSPAESIVEVNVRQERDCVLIQVRDDGRGIAKDQQERIFESFYRTPEAQISSQHGMGLGLAISKDIVERHAGRIWCESEQGKGSLFCVELPLK